MANIVQASTGTSGTIGTSLTRYQAIGNCINSVNANEVNEEITYRSAGTLSKLYIRISANSVSATSTLKSRVNGADGNMSASITASTTGEFEDTSNTDTVTAGDKLCTKITTGATGTNLVFRSISTVFSANTNTVKKFAVISGGNSYTGTTNNFSNILGRFVNTNSEDAKIKYKFKQAGTLKNLFCYLATNTKSATTTFRTRINGANGNVALSISASATGIFEDTTNTDSVSVDDLVNYLVNCPNSGTWNSQLIAIEFETTDDAFQWAGMYYFNSGIAVGANDFFYPDGDPVVGQNNANTQVKSRIAYTASELVCYISANDSTAAGTFVLRLNNANSSLSASITAGTTGYFEDTSNSVSVIATDEINYRLTVGTGGSSGTTMTAYGHLATIASGTNYTKTLTDNPTTTSTIANQTTKVLADASTIVSTIANQTQRAFADAATAASSIAFGYFREFDEAISIVEEFTKQVYKTISESVTMVENFLAQSTLFRTMTESVTIIENFTKQAYKEFVESITASELVLRQITKDISDQLTTSSAIAFQTIKTFVESITPSDTLETLSTFFRTITDTALMGESLVKQTYRSIIDSISLTEIFSTLLQHFITFADDAVTLTDSIYRFVSIQISETLSILEDFTKQITKICSDSISVIESIYRQLTRILDDSTTMIEDFATQGAAILKELVDSITPSDVLLKSVSRQISDSFSVADSIVRQVARSIADTVGITEVFQYLHSIFLTINDSVTATENFLKQIARNFTESATFNDILVVTKQAYKTLTDAATIAESIVFLTLLVFVETINLAEQLVAMSVKIFSDSITLVAGVFAGLIPKLKQILLKSIYGASSIVRSIITSYIIRSAVKNDSVLSATVKPNNVAKNINKTNNNINLP